ncbi:MAG: hypothetical protein AB1726_02755 [Planctomycetota bacterium]
MHRLLAVLGPVLLLAACHAAPPAPAGGASLLEYTVRIDDPAEERVEVELAIRGLAPETSSLALTLPEQVAFARLEDPLPGGEVSARDLAGNALAVVREAPHRWTVATAGSRELAVRLGVPLRHREIAAVLDARDAYEYPYLAADHGMLVMGTMLLAPELAAGRVRLRFALPPGWEVRCPWPEAAPGEYEPPALQALQNDLAAVGRWEEQVVAAGGCEVTVAVAPGQDGLLAQVGPLVERIVAAELDLFGCVPRKKYLFLFGRPDPPPEPGVRAISLAGSPKTGSMTLMVQGVGEGLDAARYVGHLIAHEFHHVWTNAGIPLPDELRFVGEGFTDYYAFLVLAREGSIGWEEFAGVLREKLRDYLANPARKELSLVAAGGPRFFSDRDVYGLTYAGGALFAALLDRHVRGARPGASLDELLRAFYNDPRWASEAGAPTAGDFIAVLHDFLPAEIAAHLTDLAYREDGIDFAAELAATGAAVTVEPAITVDAAPWREHLATRSDR